MSKCIDDIVEMGLRKYFIFVKCRMVKVCILVEPVLVTYEDNKLGKDRKAGLFTV